MRCGGWRISDLPAAEMRNPLMKISGFFLPGIWADVHNSNCGSWLAFDDGLIAVFVEVWIPILAVTATSLDEISDNLFRLSVGSLKSSLCPSQTLQST
jgi:hypothetical protein